MTRIATLLLCTIGVTACADAASRGDWRGRMETLPDGRVRVVNPPEGTWAADEAWQLFPELELGSVEGTDAEVFGAVSGLEVDDAGNIYVLDRQANELRIFAPDGSHLKTVGRAGAGPGEYRNANGLLWIAPDSLMVVDQRGARYTILTRDGEYVRSVQRSLSFNGWVFTGAYRDGVVYEQFSVATGQGEDRVPVLLGTPLDAGSPTFPTEVPISPQGPPLGARDTVLLPFPNVPTVESFSVRNERGGMVMGVPFTARTIYYHTADGTLWHGHGGGTQLVHTTPAGDTLREVTIAWTPAPVTQEELDTWEASDGVERFRERGGELDLSRIPREKPYFDGIFADPDGYFWISRPTAPDQVSFALLDAEGRYLGTVSIDSARRDVFLAPVFRAGRIHFVGTDALGVQRVYAYRIEKP